MLPVRAHALISLGNLLEQQDEEALKNYKKINEVFTQHLQHSDSYIYLNAVAGLTKLCTQFPETLTSILEKFSDIKFDMDGRLKYAEVLCRSVETHAHLFSDRIEPLVQNILKILKRGKKESLFIKASGLSCLCSLYEADHGKSLYKYSLDILVLVISMLLKFYEPPQTSTIEEVENREFAAKPSHLFLKPKNKKLTKVSPESSEDKLEVKRGSVCLIGYMLRCSGTSCKNVLRSTIQPLYFLLTELATKDSDESIRMHASIALHELSAIIEKISGYPLQLDSKVLEIEYF